MKSRYKLLVFFLVSSIFLFSCQAISATPSILATKEPITPTATSAPEPVIIESPVSTEPQASEVPVVINQIPVESDLVGIYERSNPGVVAIQVLTSSGNGLGSGFVIDEEGHIITNYHVIL